MATEDEKYQRLHNFLKDSFKPSELETYLKLWGFKKVAEAVNPNVEPARYFFDVIEALDHRGLIDAEFFDRLVKERPKKAAQVKELQALWIDEDRARLIEELAKYIKSATSLVDLVCCIGKAVVQAGYEKDQADRTCAQYRDRYEQRYAQVKILGKAEPVPLASIYTEVRIVPPTFRYRTQQELQDLYLREGRRLAGHDFSRDESRPALEVANDEKYQFLNLLGAPGAGKSTFLRYIGWMALQGYQRSEPGRAPPDAAALPYRFNLLPVLLELRSLRSTPLNFVPLIDEELQAHGFPAGFGRAALHAGGLLVLLDGLDEVPVDKLNLTIEGICNLAARHPGCRYITSCRYVFYKGFFPGFTDALLTDFTDDQIHNLIENWFRSDRDRELGTAATLWDLLKSTDHQATRELARTPLLATFLCLVYDDRQKLPTNRAELYGDALRILLERWGASKRVHGEPVFSGLSTKRELSMLEGIAGPAYEHGQYFFRAQELVTAIEKFLRGDAGGPDTVDGRKVVEEIEGRQGLLVQRAQDKYSFSHLTLHEYLAACHYYKSGRSQEVAKATLTEQRWREVHLLLAGLQDPHADAFLLAMTTATAEWVTSEPLKVLLSWAGRIVSVGSSPQQTAARRALMMGIALYLARARELDAFVLARNLALALARDPDRDLILDHARDHNLARDLAFACARDLDPDLAFARDLGRDHNRNRARNRALQKLYTLSPIITEHAMITAERSSRLVEACHTLDRHLKSGHASADLFAQGLENAIEGLENAIDLSPLARRLPESDARQCAEFLTCTQRILECREAAERVTQAGWDRVCERLLAPPSQEHQGSTHTTRRRPLEAILGWIGLRRN